MLLANTTVVYKGQHIVGIALDIRKSFLFIADSGLKQIVKNDYSEASFASQNNTVGQVYPIYKNIPEIDVIGGITCGRRKVYWTNALNGDKIGSIVAGDY